MPKIAKLDLSSLKLDSGTYNITAKAKANGFNDSALSNTVEYVVAYPLSGQYLFNSVMSAEAVGFPLDFECNGERYEGITYTSQNVQNSTGGTITLTGLFYYRGNDLTFVYNTSANVWLEEYYRMITPLEDSIRDEFAYQYILDNSTHYPLVTLEAGSITFNDTLLAPQWGTIKQNINFTSGGNSYTSLTVFLSETGSITLSYGNTTVYNSSSGWVDNNYKTVTLSESASVYYTFDEYRKQNEESQEISFFVGEDDDPDTIYPKDTHYALSGMTWGEWVESEYNTVGASTNSTSNNGIGDTVQWPNSANSGIKFYAVTYEGIPVSTNDVIVDMGLYNIALVTHGGGIN